MHRKRCFDSASSKYPWTWRDIHGVKEDKPSRCVVLSTPTIGGLSVSPLIMPRKNRRFSTMEILRSTKKDITIHCPECLNYMKVKRAENGSYSGKCPVCKASVFSKKHSDRERHIKIVKAAQ